MNSAEPLLGHNHNYGYTGEHGVTTGGVPSGGVNVLSRGGKSTLGTEFAMYDVHGVIPFTTTTAATASTATATATNSSNSPAGAAANATTAAIAPVTGASASITANHPTTTTTTSDIYDISPTKLPLETLLSPTHHNNQYHTTSPNTHTTTPLSNTLGTTMAGYGTYIAYEEYSAPIQAPAQTPHQASPQTLVTSASVPLSAFLAVAGPARKQYNIVSTPLSRNIIPNNHTTPKNNTVPSPATGSPLLLIHTPGNKISRGGVKTPGSITPLVSAHPCNQHTPHQLHTSPSYQPNHNNNNNNNHHHTPNQHGQLSQPMSTTTPRTTPTSNIYPTTGWNQSTQSTQSSQAKKRSVMMSRTPPTHAHLHFMHQNHLMLSQSGGVHVGVSQQDVGVTQSEVMVTQSEMEVGENQVMTSEIEVGLGAVSQFGAAAGTGVGMGVGVGVGLSPEGRGFSGVRSPMMNPLASPLPVSAC